MLILGLYMSNNELPEENKFPQKMMSHVDVLPGRSSQWVLCQVSFPLVILKNSHTGRSKTGKINLHTYRINNASLMVSPSGTYSASVDQSRERDALLSPRKPAHARTRTQHSHRKPISCQWPCWHSPRQQALPDQANGPSET